MKTWKFFALLALLIAAAPGAYAQEDARLVNGHVYEKGNRNAISGATIKVAGYPALTATSNADGKFTLRLPASGHYVLDAAAPGYDAPPPVALDLQKGPEQTEPVFYLLPSASLGAVVVSGDRSLDHISKSELTAPELRRAPGTMGDPLRALQSLPGMAISSDASGQTAVRGSGPGDNAYYADSLPIGYLFHLDGSSTVNPDLVKDFNLYSAAFPPYYADVIGAVLDVRLRNPRTDHLGGKVSVSLLGARALLEGPISDNQSFYLAGRRSYFDLFAAKTQVNGVTYQFPDYNDYQGKYLWHINDNHSLSLYVNGARDIGRLSVSPTSNVALTQPVLAGDSGINTAYATQALVLDSAVSENAYNKVSLGRSKTTGDNYFGTAGTVQFSLVSVFLREQLNIAVTNNHDITLSGNYESNKAAINLDALNATCTQFNPNCDLTTAPRVMLATAIPYHLWDVSALDRWAATGRTTLVGGVRNSHDEYLHQTYTEPRLGMEYAWSARTLFTAGWGRHNQIPEVLQILPNFGNPALTHLRADHYVAGMVHTLDDGWSWKTEVYYKKFSGLVVNDAALNYVNGGSGKAYGLETLIKKAETARLSGWFSLTLAKSERRNDVTGETFVYAYDQPVNATLAGSYKFAGGWIMGTKWTFHTGNPYTPVIGTNGTYPDGRLRPLYGAVDSARMPNYHRLDLRLDRRFVFKSWNLSMFFEIINAYNRKNVAGYIYSPTYDHMDPVYQLPRMQTFGLEGEF